MSMMGHRVHILPYSTFRLNLSVTTPYNADFDGDEMNMHLPQSLESKSEIMNIMHVPKQIVSPQSNRPVMGIVQDTLIGCKLFTARDNFLTYEQTMNIVMWIDDFDIRNLPMPCIIKPQPLWSGKQLFSLILPEKLNLTRFREDTPTELVDKLNLIDNFVQIKKGELLQGIICKKTVGASSGGIIHSIWTEVSPQKTIEFLGNCQKIINNFLLLTGWTVGISDIICDPETSEEVAKTLQKMKTNISEILTKAQTGKLDSQPGKNMIDSFESMANAELNSAREKAGVLVQKSLLPKNHLKNMVSAGSKGNSTNISQIIAFVGQQNVEGKRIPFNFQNRTLPHFLKDDYKSESKGFVENSFLKGLTPQEFYFHAMGGREGIIDTAVKTSQTGYIQRRLVKALEDIMIKYDGTVRNSLGHLMQFLYGEDGMAGEYIEDQKFETLKMDDMTLRRNFKFIEKDEEEFNLFDLKRFMEDSVIEDLKRQDLSQLRCDLEEEYNQIKRDRDYARQKLLTQGDNSINIPVNIKTIITYAENDNNINIFSKSDLNPFIVLQKVRELKQELEIIKGTDIISVEGQECALTLFNMVLNYSLSTKNIIIKHRLNKKAFDFVCGEIKSKFEQAIVRPGEMVGSIAAQSIGEPATQMTLNTFHLAGVSSANVTLGVPRLKEVINIAKKLNTPSMNIYLKEKENGYNNDEILGLRGKVEHTSLLNIVSLSEIYYDPDVKNTIINEDSDMIEEYMEIWEEEIERMKNNISPWLLRLVLNKDYINIKMETIKEIIKKKVNS
jgi:DNA-directed RNA polymerase II subunit RPB1